MDNLEIDEEVIASIWEDETDNNESGEENNNETSAKKNNSNFKALYKSNKEKEALLAQKDDELEQVKAELEEWRRLNPDTAEDLGSKKDIDSMKEEIFTTKYPDAEPHLKEIRKTMLKYSMDLKEAWKFVKIDIPEESKTKNDFSIWKNKPATKIDLSKVEFKDIFTDLTKEQRSEWRKLNWY